MATFHVTFAEKYRTEPHPVLGYWPELADGYLLLEAESFAEAVQIVYGDLGIHYSGIHKGATHPDRRYLGTLEHQLLVARSRERSEPEQPTVGDMQRLAEELHELTQRLQALVRESFELAAGRIEA